MARAGSSDIRKLLNNLMECAICGDTYRDPRILPCVHSYCLNCIEGLCRDKNPGDRSECPLCRNEFEIPKNGVEGLRKNFIVQQLKDVTEVSSNDCEGCSSDESKKSATMFCVECSQRLCEMCVSTHRRIRATRSHKLADLSGGEEASELAAKCARSFCDKHQDEALKYYCFDCSEPICVTCFVVSHNAHKCSDVSEVADEFRKQIKGDIKNLVEAVAKCRKTVKERNKSKEEFSTGIGTVERAINDRAERLMKQIEQEKQILLAEVESCKVAWVKQIDHVIEEVEQHVAFIESLVKYGEELVAKGTAGDITQQTWSVHNRAAELLQLDSIKKIVNDLGSMDVTFTPAVWPTPSSGNSVGNLKNVKCKGIDELVRIRTVRVNGFNEDCSQDLLQMFFENPRHTGGGDIEKIDINSKSQSAVITFEDAQVAHRVLTRGNFNLNGYVLTVSQY